MNERMRYERDIIFGIGEHLDLWLALFGFPSAFYTPYAFVVFPRAYAQSHSYILYLYDLGAFIFRFHVCPFRC
jgi:hypothetical protein